jgi:hypothetical protein
MKKILLISAALVLISSITTFGQEQKATDKKSEPQKVAVQADKQSGKTTTMGQGKTTVSPAKTATPAANASKDLKASSPSSQTAAAKPASTTTNTTTVKAANPATKATTPAKTAATGKTTTTTQQEKDKMTKENKAPATK